MSVPLSVEDFQQALAGRRDWAENRLAGWVRHASVLGHEASAQEFTASLYEELGFAPRFESINVDSLSKLPGFSPVDWSYEGRPNVVATQVPAGAAEGRSLILQGHVDVVSAEPTKLWKSNPFEPWIERNGENGEDWMYGRGAGDMKGGSMCYLWALAALKDMGLQPAAKVILQSPIEEECTGNGALALCAAGHRADACLIPEPFHETILHHQVGVMWFQVRVLGKTTHVLGAGRGVNAIEKSWVFIQALRRMEAEINQPQNIHSAYKSYEHPINLNVGIINGGDWASTVAGECVTRFRIGLFPGETIAEMKCRVEAVVAEAAAADPWLRNFPPQVEYVGFHAIASRFELESDFGKSLRSAHQRLRGAEPAVLNSTATTDVRFYNEYYGMPATCYGPVAQNIHGVDEKISLHSMQRCSEVIGHFIADWCKLTKRGHRS
ncbi:MAG: ArgE/DapE family deacylase [Candidatus Sumerlaeia bacterium]|nr:ArgE/DapE family deacylase [Candidatus Sumerlaeia bacterium]